MLLQNTFFHLLQCPDFTYCNVPDASQITVFCNSGTSKEPSPGIYSHILYYVSKILCLYSLSQDKRSPALPGYALSADFAAFKYFFTFQIMFYFSQTDLILKMQVKKFLSLLKYIKR